MIRRYMIIAAGIVLASCHSPKHVTREKGYEYLNEAAQLKVRFDAPAMKSGNRVPVLFTVTNPTGKPLRFLRWETPFEPRIGKYFEIKDRLGNEASFQGAMARRIMPPPESAFITVPAHDSVKTTMDLAAIYKLTPGRYTVSYNGGGVSGLRAGNRFSVSL
ncbi:hypothetical protein ACFQZI_07080 [Mucilaginibacter lutimaris]|uniref:Protease n=1 Tax=Mucilaginibacter lutimaris TaxID=931629 RepID=A0ABW2ZEK4_9SPHI